MKSRSDMNRLKKLILKDYPSRTVKSIEIMSGSFSTIFAAQEKYIEATAKSIAKAAGGATCVDLIGHS